MPADPENYQPAPIDLLGALQLLSSDEEPLLCYGIGSDGDSVRDMQLALLHHLQELIMQHSAAADSVLLAGASIARLSTQLEHAERSVQSTPDFADALAIMLPGTRQHRVVVAEGTIRFADQLHLLTAARASLVDEGYLLMFGEYLADDSEIRRSKLANLSSLKQLSERLGFELELEEEHSAAASRCLQESLVQLDQSRDALLGMGQFDQEQLRILDAELRSMISEFSTGRRVFKLFLFRKLANPPGEYAHAEYSDINSFAPAEVKELFEASFGVDFDPELWHWKYILGKGTCVVAREGPGKAIVSHYGGAPRKIDYFGVPQMAIQPCDVMVLPEVRRQYGKNSLFFKTAATFLEREIGNTVDHLLGFGFPNQKAMNIALRLGLYEKTDDYVEIVYPHGLSGTAKAVFTEIDIENEQHRQQIDRLWQSMRGGFSDGIIGVRDASYIQYRYFDHPFGERGQYQCLFISPGEGADPVALVVLKHHDQHNLVMDLVCPLQSMHEMLAALSQYSDSEGHAPQLKFWLTRGWLNAVELPGCTVNELGIEIPCNSWNPGPSSTVLYGAWWLVAGDMDFM